MGTLGNGASAGGREYVRHEFQHGREDGRREYAHIGDVGVAVTQPFVQRIGDGQRERRAYPSGFVGFVQSGKRVGFDLLLYDERRQHERTDDRFRRVARPYGDGVRFGWQ